MKFRLLTFCVIFLLPFSLVAQKNEKTMMKYIRYEGKINNSINITANIIRLDDQLSGNYQYRFIENNSEMYFGKTIELTGNVDNDGNARLKEFGRNEYAFNGIMAADSFAGTWNAPDNKKMHFEMKKYFPNGSMPLNVYYLKSEKKLDSKLKDSPSTEIELTLLFPDNYIVPGTVDSVKKIISRSFFGPGFKVTEPDQMMEEFKKENLENFIKQNEEWHKQGVSFSWKQLISLSVAFNSNYLLCLEYLKYAYTGGAHGMTNISYDIVYLETGQLLTYSDIFKENTDDLLSVLLTLQLRKDYQVPVDVPLSKAGFFVDSISPNRNIYINGNGIGFLYNSYEIAPYSTGATNVFLEFGQIKNLLRQGTPVYAMSRR
jgi:hypothetical protein